MLVVAAAPGAAIVPRYTFGMPRNVLVAWVLLASLLFGLWTVAAHDPAEHAGPTAHPDVCAICAFAGGAAGALPVAALMLLLAGAGVVAAARVPVRVPGARRALIRVRGPPSFLA